MTRNSFTNVADIYDLLFEDIDYEGWALYVSRLFQMAKIEVHEVLEVGCGTGSLTRELVKLGYDVTGVDASEGMLRVAKRKLSGVEFIKADVRELNLSKKFDAVVSTFDSLNNLLSESELLKAFKRIRSHIKEGGIFVGDLNTPYAMRTEWNGSLFVKTLKGDITTIWEGRYLGDDKAELKLTVFLPVKEGLYTKMVESFVEKGYSREAVQRLLEEAGFREIRSYDGTSFREPSENSLRITYAAISAF